MRSFWGRSLTWPFLASVSHRSRHPLPPASDVSRSLVLACLGRPKSPSAKFSWHMVAAHALHTLQVMLRRVQTMSNFAKKASRVAHRSRCSSLLLLVLVRSLDRWRPLCLLLLHHAGCPHVLGNRSDTHQEGESSSARCGAAWLCVVISHQRTSRALQGTFFSNETAS